MFTISLQILTLALHSNTNTHTYVYNTPAQSQSHSGSSIVQVIYKMHTQNKCQQSFMPNKAQQAESKLKTMSEAQLLYTNTHTHALKHTQIQARALSFTVTISQAIDMTQS